MQIQMVSTQSFIDFIILVVILQIPWFSSDFCDARRSGSSVALPSFHFASCTEFYQFYRFCHQCWGLLWLLMTEHFHLWKTRTNHLTCTLFFSVYVSQRYLLTVSLSDSKIGCHFCKFFSYVRSQAPESRMEWTDTDKLSCGFFYQCCSCLHQ